MSYGSGFGRSRDDGGSSTIKIDAHNVGKIIGRGGSKIREIEQSCNARVKIAKEADEDGMKCIDISGSDDEIEKARRMIEECLSSDSSDYGQRRGGYGGSGRGGGGSGGYGGRRDNDSSWGRRGDYEGGDRSRRRDDFDRGGRGGNSGGRGSDGDDSETILVDSNDVGRIIGRGGSRIREMEADSGCRIKVSRDGNAQGRSSVELSGSKSAIVEAKRLIRDAGVEFDNGNDRGRGW